MYGYLFKNLFGNGVDDFNDETTIFQGKSQGDLHVTHHGKDAVGVGQCGQNFR